MIQTYLKITYENMYSGHTLDKEGIKFEKIRLILFAGIVQ